MPNMYVVEDATVAEDDIDVIKKFIYSANLFYDKQPLSNHLTVVKEFLE